MKKLVLSVLLLPALALAQRPVIVEKPVVCNWAQPLIERLSKEFKETPIWIGIGEDSARYSLFTSATGAWTLIQFNDEIACIIGSGQTSQFLEIKSDL